MTSINRFIAQQRFSGAAEECFRVWLWNYIRDGVTLEDWLLDLTIRLLKWRYP